MTEGADEIGLQSPQEVASGRAVLLIDEQVERVNECGSVVTRVAE